VKLRTDSIATAGAKRQKTREPRMDPMTPSSAPTPPPALPPRRSGTETKIHTAVAAERPQSTHRTPRQPSAGSAAATGTVDSTLPSPPMETAIPVTRATFAGANHCALALMIAISPAEMPTPTITRARVRVAKLSASANSANPAAVTRLSAACTLRAPTRSSAMPPGSCATA
jgi:hypothetical protein